ncbi:MAG: hypothetical protein ACFFCS_24655 [Candidatus Hodarchaeota archaeon]
MFYNDEFKPDELRFGDVIKGFISTSSEVYKPLTGNNIENFEFHIHSSVPRFSVILTPCCNIGENQTILLTPLIPIKDKNIFTNPNLLENPLILNEEIEPQFAVPPNVWNDVFSEEDRVIRLSQGKQYQFRPYFIYEKHDIFPKYEFKLNEDNMMELNYYWIDFRHISQLKCKYLRQNNLSEEFIESKCLELSVYTRKQLREKIAHYFGRITDEDKEILELV